MLKELTNLSLLQYKALQHDKLPGYTEIRYPTGKVDPITKKKIFASIFVDNEQDYLKAIQPLLGGDCYVGINKRSSKEGKAKNVDYVSTIVFDIDPVRPKDQPSTDAQLHAANSLGGRMSEDINGSFTISSGSGCHVYVPIKLLAIKDNEGLEGALKEYTHQIQKKYQTSELRIDSIFDVGRIIRVWGSKNTKSNRPCAPTTETLVLPEPIEFNYKSFLLGKALSNNGTSLPGVSNTRFERLLKVNKELADIYSGNAVFPSRSEADYKAISILIKARFSDQEVFELAKKNPLGRGEDLREDEIKRIKGKLEISDIKVRDDAYTQDLETRKTGILCGFSKLDQMVAGFKEGRLYVVAARPTEGKTTFLTQLANNLAKGGLKVLFFTTEVGATAIWDKTMSAKTGINLRKFQFGNFTPEEKELLNIAFDDKVPGEVIVCEDFSLTVNKIEEKIKEVLPDIVIVDFLQSMRYIEGGSYQELSSNVIKIKSYAGKYNIPVVLASQLNRSADSSKLSLVQLKGTGTLEEQGDCVLFLNTLERISNPRTVGLYIMKNKYGESGMIKLEFHSGICTFKEVE